MASDINITRGDTESIEFIITNNGTAVDLTGSSVFFTAKPSITSNDTDDSTAVISKKVTNHTDPVNGRTVIPLTSTDTNVNPGTYFYDVQVKNGNNEIVSTRYDKLKVWPDVTRKTN